MSWQDARVRLMSAADLDRVLEIAASLPGAAHWPAAAYLAAIDGENLPRRIALVVEEISDGSDAASSREEHISGAKQAAETLGCLREIGRNCPSAAKAGADFAGFIRGLKPPPPSVLGFSAAYKARVESAESMPGAKPRPSARECVLGFAVASVVAPEAELEMIAVAPQFQRRGLGALLFQGVVEELRKEHGQKEKVKKVLLEVRASNRTAVEFYRAQGFEESGRRVRYYADPEEDAVLMRMKME